VQRLPISSGIGSQLRVTEDADAVYREAIDRVFQRLESDDPLVDDLVRLLELFDNDFEAARTTLSRMLNRRDQWLDAAMLALRAGHSTDNEAHDAEHQRITAITTAIRAGIVALHEAVFEEIIAGLTLAQRDSLATCAAFASKTLSRPWPWQGLPDQLDGWLFLANLITTKSGTARKQLGQAQGFIDRTTTSQAMKSRLRSVIESLVETGAIDRFSVVRLLPRQDLDAESAHALLTVATGLALSVVELTALFRRDRVVDFTELTYAAQRALGEADAPTDLALTLDHRIKHLLIDEFQDTSAIQHNLVTRLLHGWQPGDGRTVFVVGDPMQSIYRFRDADVALFQRARRHGIGTIPLESVRLTCNFRSSPALVHWCNRTFARAFGAADDPIMGQIAFAPSAPTIEGRRDDGCFCRVVSASDQPDREALLLVDTVARIRGAHPGETIAILVRNRSHLDRVLPALSARNIPWVGTDIHLLAEKPVIDDLMSLLRCLYSDADRLAWLALLRSPLAGLTLRDLETIAAGDIANAVRSGSLDTQLSPSGRIRLQRIRPTLQAAHRLRNQIRTRPWLENVFIDLGGADAYSDPDALGQANRFFNLVEAEHPWTVQFRALERSVKRLFAQTPARPEAVTVMTVHRAKGLEFDHVLLPALHRVNPVDAPPVILWRPQGRELLLGVAAGQREATIHAWLRREERQRDHHELVRLLYVAATRARFSLHLFATLEHVDSTPQAPPDESLLGQIWPIESDTIGVIPTGTPPTATQSRLRRVLPDDYVRSPRSDYREVALAKSAVATARATASDAIDDNLERAVGVIVHRALATLADGPLPSVADRYVSATRRCWRNQLENLGVPRSDLNAAADEVARQLKLVLDDAAGRWLLKARAQSDSEAGFTGFDGDDLVRVVPDRTFLDPSGVRWIIDFKSSRPDPGQTHPNFIAAQRERHVAQLRRYKRLLANLGPEPVRIAIYLTALPALVELDTDLDFFPDDVENPPP
jgi:ATP-dependent exoDNAse (exonuclease V) beta subunit